MDRHKDAVAAISGRIRRFYDRREPFRIYHGSTNSTRHSSFERDKVVDTSSLTHVLHVDPERRTVLVEPNVPMDQLVEATLPYRLVPPVVMEFPGITVGGGFAGTSGESSSFRYGFFDRTVNWIEMVLANGDVVTASSADKPDLFYGAAASFGTLGVTTLLELQLIEAKRFVELTYRPTSGAADAVRQIEELTADAHVQYLDAILFAKDRGVICAGSLTDDLQDGARPQRFTRARDPWFYLHARDMLERSTGPTSEAVPLVDYLFRYDRGAFWTGVYAFKYFLTPFNRVTRWLLDWFMHTRVMYHALHKSGLSDQVIVQDVAVPYDAARDFVEFLDAEFGIYPLWLCPLHQRGQSPEAPHGLLAEQKSPAEAADESQADADAHLKQPAAVREANAEARMLMNFGVWGLGPSRWDAFVAANRTLERKVQELDGEKWLYAHTYYSEDEFWAMYDRPRLDRLRAKYHASHLPTLYDKVKARDGGVLSSSSSSSWASWSRSLVAGVWPVRGLYGVYKALRGGDYLLPPKKDDGAKGRGKAGKAEGKPKEA